ncbi:class I SAM-dependent methyltransferase [Azonexus sp.]|uniref:class I SAM-dependent methyltransferase n=1 Tax=Azonexus sp. TaxID=1872668 RepID=UPI0035B0A65B
MTKIFSLENDNTKPSINKKNVEHFFLERAKKIENIGPVRAVIYQDKNGDLAEKRDAAEKARLLPIIKLDGTQRILDIGCGTGRWTKDLLSRCAYYHGIDFSKQLIQHAKTENPESSNLRFSVTPAENYSLKKLGESQPFDRILCFGVLIYMNDNEVAEAFQCMARAAAPKARIILREPIGIEKRLTIRDHYSDELEQNYNAIYRTQTELESVIENTISTAGFKITEHGDMYPASLNNRSETIQRWFALER